MAALTQTITIVDKSNKVVSASKQLKGVFAEAKVAYLARKAEIKAEKRRKEEVELQKAIKAVSIQEDEVRSQITSVSRRHENPRRISGNEGTRTHRSGSNSPVSPGGQIPLGQFNAELYGQARSPTSQSPYPDPNTSLQRRWTDQEFAIARRTSHNPPEMTRTHSGTEIDLDLAYGEFYDSEPEARDRAAPNALIVQNSEKQLSGLVLKCKGLLDEADCAGQSVKAIITHLQANPDAMAAVALTLAEISNIAAKMAPGALTAMKGTAPAVLALLASPEFLVAVGVGIGVTVVMFGGYKIIKKIKASATGEAEQTPMLNTPVGAPRGGVDQGGELLDVKELDRIEKWRRGIADTGLESETASVVSGYSAATSVEGEFITPFAAQSMGHLPLPKEKSKKSRKDKESKDGKDGKEKRKHRSHSSSGSRRHKDSDSDGASSEGSRRKEREGKELIKKPSPLRRMFTVTGASSSGTGFER